MPPKETRRPSNDEREELSPEWKESIARQVDALNAKAADETATATATAEPPRIVPPTIPGNETSDANPVATPEPPENFLPIFTRLVGEDVIDPTDENFRQRVVNFWFAAGKPPIEKFLRETFAGNPRRDVREIRIAAREQPNGDVRRIKPGEIVNDDLGTPEGREAAFARAREVEERQDWHGPSVSPPRRRRLACDLQQWTYTTASCSTRRRKNWRVA